MAKFLKKIPKRAHGKYTEFGVVAERVLQNVQNIDNFIQKMEADEEIPDIYKKEIKNYLHELSLFFCVEVSYKNANGLNTFENAEKTGFTQKLNDEQVKILRKISNNVKFARVLFAIGKCCGYTMLVLPLGSLYINGHNKFIYNIIQPTEIYIFIGFAVAALICILKQEKLANKIANQIEYLVNQNTR